MISSSNNLDFPITLGILGGGQLAKMLASAAYRMGLNVSIIEKESDTPAGDMTKLDYSDGWLSDEELKKFISVSDIITLENEFIDPNILDKISKIRTIFPNADTMRLVQDKYIQKTTFKNSNLPVPIFDKIDSIEEAKNFILENNFPIIIKTRKYGYDGYGNSSVNNYSDLEETWNKFNFDKFNNQITRPLMAERFVNFYKELAVIIARSVSGEISVYPCVETIQKNHICHAVIAPAQLHIDLQKEAQRIAVACVEAINGIGVFGIELFLTSEDKILINEIAPRPHNSGHYTIEACYTSQYENCIRAILDLPLGSSEMITGGAAMINLLGVRSGKGTPESVKDLLEYKKIFLHLYNKKQSRVGRKMGHVTALGNNSDEAYKLAVEAANKIIW